MAIRSIELANEIHSKRNALAELEAKSFEIREAELATAIEEAKGDEIREAEVSEAIDKFNTEKAESETEKENLRAAIAELEDELAKIENAAPSVEVEEERAEVKEIEIRKDDLKMNIAELRSTKEYADAFATAIKTGKDTELRSLLTEMVEGGVPVPTVVDDAIKHAWESNRIAQLVKKTSIKGIVKVGVEISATGAVIHTEGAAAIDEQTLTLKIVELQPTSVKKFITVSDEAMDMTSDAFLRYVYEELTYHIVKKACDEAIASIIAESDIPVASITAAPDVDTIAAAIATLSDEASKPVVIMNKATWGAFKAAQYAANFPIDVFEGCEVVFNNTLPAYASASSAQAYAIVGDLSVGMQFNFPNGQEVTVKVDDLSLAEKDLVKFVGRQYVGMGVVAPSAFCVIKK